MTPDGILTEFGQICVNLPVTAALVAVRDLTGIRCTVSFGKAPAVGSQLPTESAFTMEGLVTGELATCEDTEIDPRIHPSFAKALGFRSAAAVPINAQGSVVGLIEVFCSRPSAFSTAAIADLQQVAKSFASLMVYDAANGGQPVVGGPLTHPIVLPILPATEEAVVSPVAPDAVPAMVDLGALDGPPSGHQQSPSTALAPAPTRKAAALSQLPSDRPIPTRVWLIAAVLLVALSLLLLFLFRGAFRKNDLTESRFAPAIVTPFPSFQS